MLLMLRPIWLMLSAASRQWILLAKEDGLPKFLQDAIKKVIDEVVKKFEKKADPEAEKALKDAAGSDVQKSVDELAKKIVDTVREILNEKDEIASNRTGGSGKGGKKPAGSWLMAIATAMGKVLGEKAAEMVKLSDKISAAAQDKKDAIDKKDSDAKEKAAETSTQAQTELQGVSQEFKLLTETFSTVIKGIGESLSTMGRQQ